MVKRRCRARRFCLAIFFSAVPKTGNCRAGHSANTGNNTTMNPLLESNITYWSDGWARELARECDLAHESICLCAMSLQPPFRNTNNDWSELWQSWCRAVKRCVQVDIWLAAPQQMPRATLGNVGAGEALVRAGIGIHFVRGNRLMHSKSCVIDRCQVWIGSGNFTAAAATTNHESYIRLDSSRIANQVIERLHKLK
jgi:phosphatidylserine/phosphatidylglycerophosphate/cardiolipin synthase-like enzyme